MSNEYLNIGIIPQVHVKSTLYNVKYNGSFNYHKIIITYLFLLLCTYFKCKVDLLFIAVDVLNAAHSMFYSMHVNW